MKAEQKQPSGINATWHKAHPMPPNPTIDERIAWHLEHAAHCKCRKISGKLKEEMEKRHIKIPT